MLKNASKLSFQPDVSDFLPAGNEEKQSLVVMRESVGFWKDGVRRFKKNKVAMVSLFVIILIMLFAFAAPSFYPYSYEQQIRGSEALDPFEYSTEELALKESGESVFPHFLGTDTHGRDIMVRLMMGAAFPCSSASWRVCWCFLSALFTVPFPDSWAARSISR